MNIKKITMDVAETIRDAYSSPDGYGGITSRGETEIALILEEFAIQIKKDILEEIRNSINE